MYKLCKLVIDDHYTYIGVFPRSVSNRQIAKIFTKKAKADLKRNYCTLEDVGIPEKDSEKEIYQLLDWQIIGKLPIRLNFDSQFR